jgi:hypothetical protein
MKTSDKSVCTGELSGYSDNPENILTTSSFAHIVCISAYVAAYYVFNIIDFFRLKFDGLGDTFVRIDYIRIDFAAP